MARADQTGVRRSLSRATTMAVTWRILIAFLAFAAAYIWTADAAVVFAAGYLCAVVLEPAWRLAFPKGVSVPILR